MLMVQEQGQAADLIGALLPHLPSADAAVKTAAAKVSARLIGIRGGLQQSLLNESFARVRSWSGCSGCHCML